MIPDLEEETKLEPEPEKKGFSLFGSANLKTALKSDKESSAEPEKMSMFGGQSTGGGLFGNAGVIPGSSESSPVKAGGLFGTSTAT